MTKGATTGKARKLQPCRSDLQALEKIRLHIAANGIAPSLLEIAEMLSITKAGARFVVIRLSRDGSLRSIPGGHRSLVITPRGKQLAAEFRRTQESEVNA